MLLVYAFFGGSGFPWLIGAVYIAYDTALLTFTFWQSLKLRRIPTAAPEKGPRPSLGIIIAAYNEAEVLQSSIHSLLAQSDPPDEIIIADDGSTDGTPELLKNLYGFTTPAVGEITAPSAAVPSLRWLRAPHAGKASTLNVALMHLNTDLMLTVDADTLLRPSAIGAMRDAFAADPKLVAATGIMAPFCDASPSGKIFEWFQTYEYLRNFLGRFAWAQMNSLLLISGAFAGFRRAAVITVGGFDADCTVEDYELIHRLRRYGYDHGLDWHSTVVAGARCQTSAPATLMSFLRQRRRWFGGFLQTQYWYRDMVGARRYDKLGLWMLPVKAVDTMQPVYGLCAFGLLIWYVSTGNLHLAMHVLYLITVKIAVDLAYHLWAIHIYRQWVGGDTKANIPLAILATFAEPFSFQLFRHAGASWAGSIL